MHERGEKFGYNQQNRSRRNGGMTHAINRCSFIRSQERFHTICIPAHVALKSCGFKPNFHKRVLHSMNMAWAWHKDWTLLKIERNECSVPACTFA